MQLTCICENMESAASLDLKMSYYVFQRSPNIRMVYIQHCSELYVRLDFRGVDSTNFPVYFRSIQSLHIGNVQIPSYFSQCFISSYFVQKMTFEFDFYLQRRFCLNPPMIIGKNYSWIFTMCKKFWWRIWWSKTPSKCMQRTWKKRELWIQPLPTYQPKGWSSHKPNYWTFKIQDSLESIDNLSSLRRPKRWEILRQMLSCPTFAQAKKVSGAAIISLSLLLLFAREFTLGAEHISFKALKI